MSIELRIQSGLICWESQEIEVGFDVAVDQHGDVKVQFDTLHYPSGRSNGEELLMFEKLRCGPTRDVPFFRLSGTTQDGVSVETDYAMLDGLTERYGEGLRVELTAKASELNISYPSEPAEQVWLEYLVRATIGTEYTEVSTPIGQMHLTASMKLDGHEEVYGGFRIVRPASETSVTEWQKKCDELMKTLLSILSLSQGRWLEWTARNLRTEGACLARRIRPRKLRRSTLAHLFGHHHFEAVVQLAAAQSTKLKLEESGADMALTWMLSEAPYTESRYLHQLVAMEHLISVFVRKHRPALRRKRKSLWYKLQQLIDHYSVPVDDLEADLHKNLVKARNHLVHEGIAREVLPSKHDLRRACDFAEEFLKRMVMAIIGYEGTYISALYNLEQRTFRTADQGSP